jgi:hypothetical protein
MFAVAFIHSPRWWFETKEPHSSRIEFKRPRVYKQHLCGLSATRKRTGVDGMTLFFQNAPLFDLPLLARSLPWFVLSIT